MYDDGLKGLTLLNESTDWAGIVLSVDNGEATLGMSAPCCEDV